MKKTDKDLEQAGQRLMELYRPTAQSCRPYVLENGVPHEQSLTTCEEGILACMIAGYKDVGFASFKDDLLTAIAAEHGIVTIDDISFTPRGKEKAQILIRAKEQNEQSLLDGHNHYFYGYILGYSEKDILGFYQWLFAQDKRDAHAWVAKAERAGVTDKQKLLALAEKGDLVIEFEGVQYVRGQIPYLTAWLGGVSETEIKDLYNKNAQDRYNRDKKRAMIWIQRNSGIK